MNLQNNECRCKVPDLKGLKESAKQKTINEKVQRPIEKDCTANMLYLSKDCSDPQSSTHSCNIVDALNEQVQSLRDVVTVLEQRLTVLEEELRK